MYRRFNRPLLSALLTTVFLWTASVGSAMPSQRSRWNTRWGIFMAMDGNDNVYKLSSSQQARMNGQDSADDASGRYRDMESIDDVVLSVAPEFRLDTKSGLFDRDFSLSAMADYQHFAHNVKKSHVELGLSLKQRISKRGQVTLRMLYTPRYFEKNYLVDATDTTGHVSPSERVYHAAVYDELKFILSHHQKFPKWIVDSNGDLFVSYRNRAYNRQFPGRDEDVIGTGLALEILPAKQGSFRLGYEIRSARSPITPEVMILDESDYQIDFNGDRDFADSNRRTVQTVNRSNFSQSVEFGLSIIPIKRVQGSAGVEFTFRDFASQELIDPNHKNRNDTRTSLQLGCDYRIFKGTSLTAEYQYVSQMTNRPEDPGHVGEVSDYNVTVLRGGIQWRF